MSYKNDSMLVLSNKYGIASHEAKAEMFEVYDRIRDLTVSGPSLGGPGGYGAVGSFLMNLSRLIAPTSFMAALGTSAVNIPGTSYYSPIYGSNSTQLSQSAFGMGNITNYPGFPGGAAPLSAVGALGLSSLLGIGGESSYLSDFAIGSMSSAGQLTGGAASVAGGNSYTTSVDPLAGVSMSAGKYSDLTLPVAGVVAGVGGLVGSLAPYFGPFGILAGMSGNFAEGAAGAVISGYQRMQAQILNNADTILSMKVKNIETVVKELDTQGDMIKKMLKSGLEGDSKAIQEM
jgi:hypothetical protein